MPQSLSILTQQIAACRLCEASLPHRPRPVVVASEHAKLLIIGQAPGRRVHETGIPWNDPSGKRLREWLQLTPEQFYQAEQVAIMPMGFCFPGSGKNGDLPPRAECARQWHGQLLQALPEVKLTLLIGQHAQAYYLPNRPKTLTQTVQQWRDWAPTIFALPHPSPRNQLWLKKNPWFASEVLPALRQAVEQVLL